MDLSKDFGKAAFLCYFNKRIADGELTKTVCPWEHKHKQQKHGCGECKRRWWALAEGWMNEITVGDMRKAASAAVNGEAYRDTSNADSIARVLQGAIGGAERTSQGASLLSSLLARFPDAPGVRCKTGTKPPGWGGLDDNANLNDDNWNGIGAKPAEGLPITSPSTPEAVKWDGWHSAGLKPSTEICILARKPLTQTDSRCIMVLKLVEVFGLNQEEPICRNSPADTAVSSSTSSPLPSDSAMDASVAESASILQRQRNGPALDAGSHSALTDPTANASAVIPAPILPTEPGTTERADTNGATGTSCSSAPTENTDLSTGSLWSEPSADPSPPENSATTSTRTEPTTARRTCASSPAPGTSAPITPADDSLASGRGTSATPAECSLPVSGALPPGRDRSTTTAPGPASEKDSESRIAICNSPAPGAARPSPDREVPLEPPASPSALTPVMPSTAENPASGKSTSATTAEQSSPAGNATQAARSSAITSAGSPASANGSPQDLQQFARLGTSGVTLTPEGVDLLDSCGYELRAVTREGIAVEVVLVAQKPFTGPVRENVRKHGVGGFNIGECRIPFAGEEDREGAACTQGGETFASPGSDRGGTAFEPQAGRYPANLLCSDAALGPVGSRYFSLDAWTREHGITEEGWQEASQGGLVQIPKASKAEKTCGGMVECKHPTTKPLALMEYLLALASPPGGTVLDPFCGSGTTIAAAILGGYNAVGIELSEEYCQTARDRCKWAERQLVAAQAKVAAEPLRLLD